MDYMNKIGEKVITKAGEIGLIKDVIINKDGQYIIIEFKECRKRYQLSSIKNGFLKFFDETLQKQIEDEIEEERIYAEKLAKERAEKAEQARIERELKAKEQERVEALNIRKNGNDKLNAAYKANYCSNGEDWFKSPCSKEVRELNCNSLRSDWCRTRSLCHKLCEGECKEKDVLEAFNNGELCYESNLLNTYVANAGYTKNGDPMGMSLDKDRLFVLTTLKPGLPENERIIFGAFLVKEVYPKTETTEARAVAYDEYRLALTEKEAQGLKYWKYVPADSDGKIKWTEKLVRKRTDAECVTILNDIVSIIDRRPSAAIDEKNKAHNFLNKYLSLTGYNSTNIPPKNGAL